MPLVERIVLRRRVNMWNKITKTVAAVVVFVSIMLLMIDSARADQGDPSMTIGLGHTINHSSATVHDLTFSGFYDNIGHWDTQLRLAGEGDTKNGYQEQFQSISICRVIDPGWSIGPVDFKSRIGYVYSPDSVLIGDTNFRLGIITSWFDGLFTIEAAHDSSASLWDPNTGLDGIHLGVPISWY